MIIYQVKPTNNKAPLICFDFPFFSFWWHWDLNSGPHTCLAGAQSLEPLHQPNKAPLIKLILASEAGKPSGVLN
jgi:cell division FtsZ-interacting protein ZapD